MTTMPDLTPGQKRTANATATKVRTTDEKLAARLLEHGWLVVPPERVAKTAPACCHREEIPTSA